MRIFDKIRYTKALLVILPLGLVFLYLGIDYITNTAASIGELKKVEGIVSRIDSHPVYIEQCSCYIETIFIEVEDESKEFFNREKVKVEIINRNIKLGDRIILGYDRYNQIKFLSHTSNVLIEYEKSNIYSYVFIILGVFLILFSIYYLITQKNDLK